MSDASIPDWVDDVETERAVRWDDELWQHGFTIVPNGIVVSPTVSTSAFRLYALFLHYAREDAKCWPGQDGLALVSGMGERTIRTATRELEELGLLRTIRRGLGKTNLYVLIAPRRPAENVGSDRPNPPLPPSRKKTQGEEEILSLSTVVASWRDHVPPLTAHRDSFFADSKTKTAIRAALRVYDADSVAAAIANYATVLGSDEHRWSYRWTLIEFLRRGLDRFVPEADPLTNFRAFGKPKPDYDLSGVDQLG